MTHEPECDAATLSVKGHEFNLPCICEVARAAYRRGREDAEREVLAMDIRRSIHWLADKSGSWTCVPVDAAAAAARGETNTRNE